MKNQQIETVGRDPGAESHVPGWWVVAKKELAELWLGGRAMILMILFSVLLGIVSYLLATNSEMKILPPREMLFLTIQNTIAVGLFVGILIGADSISGERERATLEGLLLVPSSRRQIVVGKFLAAISPWPVALLLASAHLKVLAPTPQDFQISILLAATLGTLLVFSFTGFGLLLSLWSESNRTSLFVGLFTSIIFLIPTQFPGQAQAGIMGQTIKRINPMESVNQFVEKLVVNNRTFDEMSSWLTSPIIFAVVVLVVLFWYAAPRLALDSRQARLPWPPRLKRAPVVASLLIVLALPLFMAVPASAQREDPVSPLQISIDKSYLEVKTGDSTEFQTVVQYNGSEESTPMVVAMNIVNLGEGEPVDPEDWSPERTQEVEPLAPGESAEQTWTITAILAGDYLAYMTVIPEPQEPGDTSSPVSSPGIRFTVEAFAPLNPSGVLPVAVGLPIGLILIFAFQKLLGPGRNKTARLDRAAA
jgi:ABC-2 type transport system permease protein